MSKQKESLNPLLGKEVKLNYPQIESQIKFLQGKVLTIIDASFSEGVQKKSVKDLINSVFSEQLSWVLQLCAPETPIYSREQAIAEGIDVEKIEMESEPVE